MLIIDMQMPKCCEKCDVEIYGVCGVTCENVLNEHGEYEAERPSWCPIKCVLPETHGDLIDRDALKDKKVYSHERHEYVVPVAYIDWQDAVISAERKDDGTKAD